MKKQVKVSVKREIGHEITDHKGKVLKSHNYHKSDAIKKKTETDKEFGERFAKYYRHDAAEGKKIRNRDEGKPDAKHYLGIGI